MMNAYTHGVQDTQREAVSHMDWLLRRRLERERSRDLGVDAVLYVEDTRPTPAGGLLPVGADGFEPPTSALQGRT